MNLLHFIIFIVVLYYCAYVLDFVVVFFFTYCCKLLRKNPFGSINKVIQFKPFLMRVITSGSCSQHFNLIACCCPVERSNNKALLSTKEGKFYSAYFHCDKRNTLLLLSQ